MKKLLIDMDDVICVHGFINIVNEGLEYPSSEHSIDEEIELFKQDLRIIVKDFLNKDDKETKEFYFLGEINAHGNPTEVRMPESNDTAFEIQYKLETPVRADIFEYITEG